MPGPGRSRLKAPNNALNVADPPAPATLPDIHSTQRVTTRSAARLNGTTASTIQASQSSKKRAIPEEDLPAAPKTRKNRKKVSSLMLSGMLSEPHFIIQNAESVYTAPLNAPLTTYRPAVNYSTVNHPTVNHPAVNHPPANYPAVHYPHQPFAGNNVPPVHTENLGLATHPAIEYSQPQGHWSEYPRPSWDPTNPPPSPVPQIHQSHPPPYMSPPPSQTVVGEHEFSGGEEQEAEPVDDADGEVEEHAPAQVRSIIPYFLDRLSSKSPCLVLSPS